MPESQLVDADCEIIIRDENLEDDGEVRDLIKFDTTLKLNDISSWQLEMHTDDYNRANLVLGRGIIFRRDDIQILSGPVMLVKTHELAGARTTTIVGGSDDAYLDTRICYPVTTGLIFENGNWRFGKKRIGDISSNVVDVDPTTTTTQSTVNTAGQTHVQIANANGFLQGTTVRLYYSAGGTSYESNVIAAINYPSNELILATNLAKAVSAVNGAYVKQFTNAIIDDPAFLGFDTRSGHAETVIKELVYFNAGIGACADQAGWRAIPHLVVAPSRGGGTEVVSNARFESLLLQCQNLATAGGICFAVKQVGTDLVFDTFNGSDLTGSDAMHPELVFSTEAGNLKEYEVQFGLPEGNFILGAGPNAGVQKIMLPTGDPVSISQFGRFETVINAPTGNTTDTPEMIRTSMLATNTNAIMQMAYNSNIAISLQETDQVRFPRDFNVGDRVRTMIGYMPVDHQITNIVYSIPSGTTAASSAVGAFTKLQMSRLMVKQNRQAEIIKQLMLT